MEFGKIYPIEYLSVTYLQLSCHKDMCLLSLGKTCGGEQLANGGFINLTLKSLQLNDLHELSHIKKHPTFEVCE